MLVDNLLKGTADFETGMAEKVGWGQANKGGKTWFGLEKQKENKPNYQRVKTIPLLTVLPLNYFMLYTHDTSIGSLYNSCCPGSYLCMKSFISIPFEYLFPWGTINNSCAC